MRFHSLILILAGIAATRAAESPMLVTGGLTNAAGASDSFLQAITPDGRRAVFVSHANNVATNDGLQSYTDIFVRDFQAGTTVLVSVRTNGSGGGNGNSHYASISPDGRYVVFASEASNLIPNDTNEVSDVFRRDLQTGTTELLSVARTGGVAATSVNRVTTGASKPTLTPNGRWVTFESSSMELVEGDTNATGKIFVRDLQTGVTRLATAGAEYSRSGRLTENGRYLAFVAEAAQSMPGRRNTGGDVFVTDLETGQQFWASTNLPSPVLSVYKCLAPVVTPDGRTVFFKAITSSTYVLQHDLTTGETTVITAASYSGTPLALSADGHRLAFEDNGFIYLRDWQIGTNQFVAYGGSGPVMTPDARHVAFLGSESLVGSDNQVFAVDVIAGTKRRVTRATNGAWIKMSAGNEPLITADGASVFFDTAASDVVGNDHNGAHDVFRHDLQSSATDLVSVADFSRPARSAMRSVTFDRDMVDATATRIAFVSPDMPGFPGDTNAFPDVFVKDVATGVLHGFPMQFDFWATNFPPNSKALDPQISADGVALICLRQNLTNGVPESSDLMWFVIGGDPPSAITNLGPAPAAISSNGQVLVYQQRPSSFYTWHDLVTGIKTLITVGPDSGGASPPPQRPVVSGDRRWLAYRSGGGVVVYNVRSNSVARLDRTGDGGIVFSSHGGDIAASADSRFLFFEGLSASPYPTYRPELYRHDLQNRRTDLICTNCINPSPSGDGNILSYNLSPQGFPRDIVVHDLQSGVKELITGEFLPTNAFSRQFSAPSLSADGRYVVFSTTMTNALAGDFNSRSDVYVYDRVQRSTLLISRSRFGEGPAAGSSTDPVMARDGRSVVFQSFANDLVESDYNEERDIFVVKLGAGDSDNDGMDDDWEVAHFGNLNRDGAGDEDDDGQTDLQEFLAGTDPANSASILRVLTITPMGGGSTTLVWSAVVGRNYVVQYKDSLDASWTNASGVIEANSVSMSFTHNSSSPQRFYRVVGVQ